MRRFVAKNVDAGFVMSWCLAEAPTRRLPFSVNATTDGVVGDPERFLMTRGTESSTTATHEFVVPRSIPIMWLAAE
jgi:hypothetical protein